MGMDHLNDEELKKVGIVCDCGCDKLVISKTDAPIPSLKNEYACLECGQFYTLPLNWEETNK